MPGKAKQTEMPGMEDREIKPLKETALEYAEMRDQRMELGSKESELKDKLLALMKEHKKETYRYGGIEIRVVHDLETVKVKVERETRD
jgi:hypothetical protein